MNSRHFANRLAAVTRPKFSCLTKFNKTSYRKRSLMMPSDWRADCKDQLSPSTFRCSSALRVQICFQVRTSIHVGDYEHSLGLNLTGALLSAGIPFLLGCYLWSPSFAFAGVPTSPLRSIVFNRPHEESRKEISAQSAARRFPTSATTGSAGNGLDSMVERIETLIRTQRNLLTSVSHELRSP